MNTDFSLLEKRLGYSFKDSSLLKTALCHKSYINEAKTAGVRSYERLEFLGDAVLGVVVSRYIYDNYSSFPEGALSRLRASVVCESSLAAVARRLGLGEFIFLSHGEELTGGYDKDAILCDVTESVIAAMYLDSDMGTAAEFIMKILRTTIEEHALLHSAMEDDFKTALQEAVQKDGGTVTYDVLSESGPDHEKTYVVAACVNGNRVATGSGGSKKKAQQDAAEKALEKLNKA